MRPISLDSATGKIMTEHEQIREFLKSVSIPATCGIRGEGVSCKICFVFTPSSEIVETHAPNCCIQVFYNPRPLDISTNGVEKVKTAGRADNYLN